MLNKALKDYLSAGFFKSSFFLFRFLSVIMIAEHLSLPGRYLLFQFIIEIFRIFFDAGLEIRLLKGLSFKCGIKAIVRYRLMCIVIGQALILVMLFATESESDTSFLFLSTLLFSVLMVYGCAAAIIQVEYGFEHFLKKNVLTYVLATAVLVYAAYEKNIYLLLVPEVLISASLVLFLSLRSGNRDVETEFSILELLISSKHYAFNSFYSAWYTRFDALVIFIYSLHSIAADYMLVQRYLSLPLFLVSIVSSLFLTKASAESTYLGKRHLLTAFSTLSCCAYFSVIINYVPFDAIFLAVSVLTIIRIINSFLTASIIAVDDVAYVRMLSGVLTLLSLPLIALYGAIESLLYIPCMLIFAEVFVYVCS
ncbi:MAG: hypothetical protein VW124_20910, partial [Paracoccaceae bacterium]